MRSLLREIVATCVAQRVTSAVVGIIAAVSVGLVLGTAGLSAAAQAQVLTTVDQAGTRSLTIYSKSTNSGFPTSLVDQLSKLDIVDHVTGIGQTVDTSNASFSGGKRVALREVYGSLAEELTRPCPIGTRPPVPTSSGEGSLPLEHPGQECEEQAQSTPAGSSQWSATDGTLRGYATEESLDILGIPAAGGTVRVVNDGMDIAIVGTVQLPQYLEKLSPTILLPVQNPDYLNTIYVSTHTPAQVPLLKDLVRSELREYSSEDYSVETSEAYGKLRAAIDGQLTASTHTLILGVLAAAAGATMLVVWAVVLLRRKDLGRRRALGATRVMIVSLVIGQVALLATTGATLAIGVACAVMAVAGQPFPPASFAGAVALAVISISTLMASIPALWAAHRDPLSELRVP